ncbi:MAG: transferrin-binding protein-like solute binding protein [Campylobacterales bacterium]|nr:transferrin-binding protein-like solute binding protein [Campylobacterales bacterium]
MKILNIFYVIVIAMILSACGGGGSGSAEPTATIATYTGLEAATGDDAGVASVVGVGDDAVYTYNFKGTPVDVTLDGISAGTFYTSTEGAIAQHIGGTTYSYSRFGVIASYNTFSSGDHITEGEVFYVGQKTSSMPTTGTATYHGHTTTLSEGDFLDASVTFDVDYGSRKISGNVDDGMIFDETNIVGSDFSGTVSFEAEAAGDYHGSFFGPNAEELGGVGTLGDESGYVGFSFGAQKE